MAFALYVTENLANTSDIISRVCCEMVLTDVMFLHVVCYTIAFTKSVMIYLNDKLSINQVTI